MRERGAAVTEYVLVMMLLVPLVLGIIQVGLVLHVRNTAAAAASEGARAAAPLDSTLADGTARAQQMIRDALDDRYADGVSAAYDVEGGVGTVEIVVRGKVPALGLFGPSVGFTVRGHAVREVEP